MESDYATTSELHVILFDVMIWVYDMFSDIQKLVIIIFKFNKRQAYSLQDGGPQFCFTSQRYATLRAWAESASIQTCVSAQMVLKLPHVIFTVS